MAKRVFVLFFITLMTVKAQETSALLEALSYMPDSESIVEFTDMELIKKYEGAEGITSRSPLEARESFIKALSQNHFVSLGDIASQWQQNAELWGFDPTDIRWSLTSSKSVTFVIAFREDFDFTILTSFLKSEGLRKTPMKTP